MTAAIDQVKNVAYTSLGVNLIVSDAVVSSIREQRPEFADRFERRAENLFSSAKINIPDFVEEQAEIARKHGADALVKFHNSNETRAAKLEERLPARVSEVVTARRRAAWEFLNVEALANKSSPKKGSAKKSPGKSKAEKTEGL